VAVTALVPAVLSSGLRRGVEADARRCSVLTALGSGVGSSRQQGGGGQALVPVAASSGVWLLRAELRAGAAHLRRRQLWRAGVSAAPAK
jgi:hypothetical protein